MAYHEEKLKGQLLSLCAAFVQREKSAQSLITVTGLLMDKELANAVVLVSVLPESAEELALAFLKRKRSDLYAYVVDHVRIGRVPLFNFAVDRGEKSRQQLDKALLDDKIRLENESK
ncbi:MAG: hypothetical protein A2542_02065 [Parcubacteria group bacterium RIFOXYD2_FULL_52_8]|nr:MAG: hypothetical protein A2542_02065 [Parcubacteria group bacterium RIFOXYD2_FULL_52_8]